ncbi:hypothetical protein HOLleu_21033 [Holothuria leucospilota]|uniref:Uncharacterized protein n=1 Tax=Holothuria leucospilota TaxID=206669 RepID=A0A9Q1BWZ3_HOLLE|nr:hypothetical protein HOLleu_21033 [Holothuria leucospilota]
MDLDALFGAPRPSKKPSTLRRSRSPPAPRHIDKQRAISIARQLKLTNIGKVSLRSTSKQNFDVDFRDPSHSTDTRITRKLLIDKRRGIETARNAKDSAIGQCILQTNEYASRKLLVEQDKLVEDRERRKKYLTRKKREFRIRCAAAESNKFDSSQTGQTLPTINTVNDKTTAMSRPKRASAASPNYMRPLTCDKLRSNETAVAETERFLNSPFIRAVLTEEMEKMLAAVETNDEDKPDKQYDTGVKHNDETKPSMEMLRSTLQSRMHLNDGNPSGESTKGFDKTNTGESDEQNTAPDSMPTQEKKSPGVDDVLKLTPPPSRSKSSNLRLMQNLLLPFMQKESDVTIPDIELQGDIPSSNVNDKPFSTLHNRMDETTNKNSTVLQDKGLSSSPVIGRFIQSRKESHRKKRRRKESFFVRADRRFIDLEKNPAYSDERFTKLTSSLIPDSSRSRNLYYEADTLNELRPSHAASQQGSLATALTAGKHGENLAKFEKLIEQQYTKNLNSSYF